MDTASSPADDRNRTNAARLAAALGATVRRRRRQLGITQTELAELADCSLTFVSQLEGGKATLKLDKILDVLAAAGLGLAVLADGSVLPLDDDA